MHEDHKSGGVAPLFGDVRKHRAPKGALRPRAVCVLVRVGLESEGTERKKVH